MVFIFNHLFKNINFSYSHHSRPLSRGTMSAVNGEEPESVGGGGGVGGGEPFVTSNVMSG